MLGFKRIDLTVYFRRQLLLTSKKPPRVAFSFKPDRKIATSGGITKRYWISGDAGIIVLKRTSWRAKGY